MLDGGVLPAGGGSPLGFADALRDACYRDSQQCVLVDETGSVSYGEMLGWSNSMAVRLAEAGVGVGDAVMVCLPNCRHFPAVVAACEMRGATVVLSAPTVAESETVRRARLVAPKVCVALARDGIVDAAAAEGVAVIGLDLNSETPMGCVAWGDANSAPLDGTACLLQPASGVPGNLMVFTSGSTGLPKAVVCRMESLFRNAARMDESYGACRDDVFFIPPPFTHVFGLVGLCASLRAGATTVVMEKFNPARALPLMERTKTTIEYGVSTMLSRQLSAPFDGVLSLKTFVVGGDSCAPTLMDAFERRFGCVVVQSWGMTEAASTLTATRRNAARAVRRETVGSPISGVRVKTDPATGELLCKGPDMAVGFFENGKFRPLETDADGWFRTGDAGEVDDSGAVRITGRLKDVIIRGGMNIYPPEVERVYRQHPDIVDCCLVGFPDAELGERACLCAVLRPGARMSSREARAWGRGKLEKCRLPDAVRAVDCLPLLANGKVDKMALRRQTEIWANDTSPQFK